MDSSKLFMQLLSIFFIISLNVKSQDYSIEITSERNDDQSVDFSYTKRDHGTFYLNLQFNQLVNTSTTSFKEELYSLGGKFLTLRPINPNSSIGYSYKYTYIRGVLNPKIDDKFVYLLPISKGKTLKALELSNLGEKYFGNIEPKGWKAFQFLVQPGDTVFSSRKGLVVEVKDGNLPDSIAAHSYRNKSNSILIEHDDGTLAKYDVLKNGSHFVEPGQKVFPHAPLAIAGTYDLANNTQVRFYVYYLIERDLEHTEKSSLANSKNFYAYINPLFHTKEGDVYLETMQDYTADYTAEHILKELNKREMKKVEKNAVNKSK